MNKKKYTFQLALETDIGDQRLAGILHQLIVHDMNKYLEKGEKINTYNPRLCEGDLREIRL